MPGHFSRQAFFFFAPHLDTIFTLSCSISSFSHLFIHLLIPCRFANLDSSTLDSVSRRPVNESHAARKVSHVQVFFLPFSTASTFCAFQTVCDPLRSPLTLSDFQLTPLIPLLLLVGGHDARQTFPDRSALVDCLTIWRSLTSIDILLFIP